MHKWLVISAIGLLGIACTQSRAVETLVAREVLYTPSTENLLNPERGCHQTASLIDNPDWGLTTDYSYVRKAGYTLVRAHVRLDAYRQTAIPDQALAEMQTGFADMRKNGIKATLVFSYNFPDGIETGSAPDATLTQIRAHLEQLKPIFASNQDVIATLETGFVGAWGEWHSSSNQLDTQLQKRQVFEAILEALPPSRMMQLRLPADHMLYYPTPVEATNAFDGSNQSRAAFANMCFLSNEHDAGTYLPLENKAATYAYLEKMTKYTVMGGETCQVSPSKARTDCPTALNELQRFHWSYINAQFYKPALEQWKSEGCFDQINQRLGYRLELKKTSAPDNVPAGTSFLLNISLQNIGFAAPYNSRGLEIILKNKTTGAIIRQNMLKARDTTYDPRFWLPENGAITLDSKITAPQAGLYDVFLALPDPLLPTRADYAIQIANTGVWDATLGANKLREITIQ